MKNDVLIVVPARLGSSRFPAKVLKPLLGKPVVQWVYEACSRAGAGEVLIATEHKDVVRAVEAFGGKAVLTPPSCQSGTDRVYSAAKRRKERIIINVQGDEPFISRQTVRAVVGILLNDKTADISTACAPISDLSELKNPNCVKAALAADGTALYFSRSAIPFRHPLAPASAKNRWFKHCGIYGYRRESLERFVALPPSPLEKLERLEQLRALEAGMTIKCAITKTLGPAIDVPGDIKKAERYAKTIRG